MGCESALVCDVDNYTAASRTMLLAMYFLNAHTRVCVCVDD